MVDARSYFVNRRKILAHELKELNLDALVISHLTHVRYLSGFTGSNAGLVVYADGQADIATDGRYLTQIAAEVPDIKAREARACAPDLIKGLSGVARLGFEADFVTVTQLEILKKAAGEGLELVPVTQVIEKMRRIKGEEEQERLRRVADIANSAFQELLDEGGIRAGRSEIEIAADLEYKMRVRGSERPSFDTIVASGPNSAMPHHQAGDRILCEGDIVTIDFGAYAAGYNSDTTRTVIVGYATDFSQEIYDVVLQAQLAGCKAAVPGTSLADVDKACRDIITKAGYGDYFVHSTGHGVGLDVHEAPAAAKNAAGVLCEGMTVTIEPGIYIPERGGVRIEDTLIVQAGAAENLTGLSKDLMIV
ncbi:aminopeptidase P family protein [Corynebacterium sp. ES2730-CONJ]|uniref:M24 family metallopeptidase n=1 Tax=Corynebacterium sp. ES2730-CONJ TaxID=2973941 RepID=UPI00216B43BD|nr:aminopeptidase P family protein [Corynebacterium sp. ES2730-CONJ]MCS4531048.1 aminopeptidase P family protein [Corynebacterium sp. ES2730-CONJ]